MQPQNVASFPELRNLRPGETVKMVLRRHWIVLVHTFFYLFFLVASSIALLVNQSAFQSIFPSAFALVVFAVYASMFLLFIYVDWISNELDFFVLTNERIIGVEQVSFLNRVISECSMDRVQEVNASSKGLLANIFNYGTVDIHTASEDSRFEMHVVGEPLERARGILNVVQEYRAKHAPQAPTATTPATTAPAAMVAPIWNPNPNE